MPKIAWHLLTLALHMVTWILPATASGSHCVVHLQTAVCETTSCPLPPAGLNLRQQSSPFPAVGKFYVLSLLCVHYKHVCSCLMYMPSKNASTLQLVVPSLYMNWCWIIFGRCVAGKVSSHECYIFPLHLNSASALPSEIGDLYSAWYDHLGCWRRYCVCYC